MNLRRHVALILGFGAVIAACGKSPSAPSVTPTVSFTPPAALLPAEAAQLNSFRVTLVVKNGAVASACSDVTTPSGCPSGALRYEFQVSDKNDFSTTTSTGTFSVLARQTGIAEGPGGSTSYTPDFDLQPATRFYWRSRIVQGGNVSDWSATRTFNTAIAGYNRAGELFDPLVNGVTVGVPVGSTAFVPGKGIRLNDQNSYVRYQLAQNLDSGEFSMEIEGLYTNGPGAKLKVFSMMDGTGDLDTSPYLLNAQYRGGQAGNPDNAIAFKMLIGDGAYKIETDGGQRAEGIRFLDPTQTYFWKGTWNDGFRLVIRQGGVNGSLLYDMGVTSTEFLGLLVKYNPAPHFAYLGANNGQFKEEDGSWPGATYRNVWIGRGARPASLGTAIAR